MSTRRTHRSDRPSIDASEVAERLFVGGCPDSDVYDGEATRAAGFDMIVLCAQERQRIFPRPASLQVVNCPIDDSAAAVVVPESLRRIRAAVKAVVTAHKQGAKILCVCQMGWNRSSLIAALSLKEIFQVPGHEAVMRVRAGRNPDAAARWYGPGSDNVCVLCNRHFAAYVTGVGPLGLVV